MVILFGCYGDTFTVNGFINFSSVISNRLNSKRYMRPHILRPLSEIHAITEALSHRLHLWPDVRQTTASTGKSMSDNEYSDQSSKAKRSRYFSESNAVFAYMHT